MHYGKPLNLNDNEIVNKTKRIESNNPTISSPLFHQLKKTDL